jgi:cytochrome c
MTAIRIPCAPRSRQGPASSRRPRLRTVGLVIVAASLQLFLGTGCRDPDREILASFDSVQEAKFRSGRAVANPCWVCHDLAGTVRKVGPSLLGLYGRRSGMVPDYSASPALIGATIVWDDRTLAAFLSNPTRFIPGNRMVSPGVQGTAALSDLLFYLREVTRPGARESRID